VNNTSNVNGFESYSVLDNFDLQIQRGKISTLIGGNGAGKTTLFNIISGFLDVNSGEIWFKNQNENDLLKFAPHKRVNLGIGRMFQDNHIFKNLTVLENMLVADGSQFGEFPFVSIFKQTKNKQTESQRKEKAVQIIKDIFGNDNLLLEKLYEPAHKLSFGYQRLLGLARLFMTDYKLILIDEPTAGINPEWFVSIQNIIRKFATEKGVTIFLIEHNMQFVAEISDICCFLNKGKIEVSGKTADVLANDLVRKKYIGL
jgi:ABC-type branched-subunit amino acid transport system ATPase component